MKYLYTTEPDEGCHEIKGVYGRPVHTSEQPTLKAKGWKENPDDLREEGREEKEVDEIQSILNKQSVGALRKASADKYEADMRRAYEQKFGKRPHHKAKVETIRQKLEEPND